MTIPSLVLQLNTVVLPTPTPTPSAIAFSSAYVTAGDFILAFLTSPGFGGVAALIAAITAIAFGRRQMRVEQSKHRQERWWSTLTWVAERAMPADPKHDALSPEVSARILNQLVKSASSDPLDVETVGALTTALRDRSRPSSEDASAPPLGDSDLVSTTGNAAQDAANADLDQALAERGVEPYASAFEYEKRLLGELRLLARSQGLKLFEHGAQYDTGFDAVISGSDRELLVEIKFSRTGKFSPKLFELLESRLNYARSAIGRDLPANKFGVLLLTNSESPQSDSRFLTFRWRDSTDTAALGSIIENYFATTLD